MKSQNIQVFFQENILMKLIKKFLIDKRIHGYMANKVLHCKNIKVSINILVWKYFDYTVHVYVVNKVRHV